MPGRDDLIQQNIARVRSKVSEPALQEEQGKNAESAASVLGSGPKSFFGGNYDVYSALDSIQFQGSLGDASMRGNIAYIRIWKRGGTAAQTGGGAQTQDPGPGSLGDLQEQLEAEIGNRDNISRSFDPDTRIFDFYSLGPVDNPLEVVEANILFLEAQINEERQRALGTQTPTSSSSPSPSTVGIVRASQSSSSTTNSGGGIGVVRSANPSGFTNILSSAARVFTGASPLTRPTYSGGANAPKSGTSSAPAGEMMWQFLFNPSELELEAGPEFKGAEVWGVSDKANSGQPLHWSHNKNAQLKFNSVLLNGFVFGRKVEVLEQGLIELFMSRDGEGQHGPHVLEFVWGKRSFGPCVIKNINVKEKMWDEGEVVNAELSFTLEQIPEWTINDGAYVDVARPGRQALVADAAQIGSAPTTTPTTAPTTNAPPGGGSGTAQKPRKNNGVSIPSQERCQRAYYYTGLFTTFRTQINNVNPIFGSRDDTRRITSEFLIKFQSAAQELGSEFASTSEATEIYKKIEDILNPNRPGGRLNGGQIKGYVNGYIQRAVNKAGAIYNNKTKCPTTSGNTPQPSRPAPTRQVANPTNL
jgi:hypothetical protein